MQSINTFKIEIINGISYYKKMCISNDRKTLVYMDYSGNIKIIRGKSLIINGNCSNMILSPDGNTLVKFIQQYDPYEINIIISDIKQYEDIKQIKSITIPSCKFSEICEFSPDGNIFFIKSGDNKLIFYSNIGEYLFDVNDRYISLCNFSEDGGSFHYNTFRKIVIINPKNGEIKYSIDITEFDIEYPHSISISKNIMSIGQFDEIILVDIETKEISRNTFENCRKIRDIKYSPNKQFCCFINEDKIKIYHQKYGYVTDVYFGKVDHIKSYALFNDKLIFLNGENCMIVISLYLLFKEQNTFRFLLGGNQKESSVFNFNNNALGDSKNLCQIIFSHIPN